MHDLESRQRGRGRDKAEVFIVPSPPLSLFLPVTHSRGTNCFSPQPCAAVKSNMTAKSIYQDNTEHLPPKITPALQVKYRRLLRFTPRGC